MLDDLRPTILSVVSGVFETMCFIILEPMARDEDQELPKGKEKEGWLGNESTPFIKSEIGFQGDDSGRIALFMPWSLARSMTVNFLGLEEEEVSESQTLDMAGEITNMISGNFLSLLNKKEGYKLTVPKTEVLSALNPQGQEQDSPGSFRADFYGEGQRIRVQIQFDSGSIG